MSNYKIAVNLEWTGKCDARCVMCPRHMIEHPRLMTIDTLRHALDRINPNDVFRTVIAGYGEPATHPRFREFISLVGEHPGRFDMVSNGQQLDAEKIRHLDGKIGVLVISFSSINRDIYQRVHVNLDHEKVKSHIALAAGLLRKTSLAISLTPLSECIDSLPETISWLHQQGISHLTMSPTLYNRAGSMDQHRQDTRKLREIIRRYHLRSQEFDFIPSVKDIFLQNWCSRFRCLPRNSDLFITATGDYLYCYNDISHKQTIGRLSESSIREILNKRETMGENPEICIKCNMRSRYSTGEIIKVAANYLCRKALSEKECRHQATAGNSSR